jgi:predicted lipid-binding transport protein (Tim44 family)
MIRLRFRPLIALCAVAAAFVLIAAGDADARAGRGGSFGSRGGQSFKPAPPTNTAPNAVRPMERSVTPQPGGSPAAAARPGFNPGGFIGRPGFMGGLFAGLLGAGLIGMLFGHGLLGGLGGLASMLGLLLQIGLVAGIAYFLWTWWQRRNQPALASGPSLRDASSNGARPGMGFAGFGGLGGSGSGGQPAARAAGTDEVGLTPDDFNAFEKVLGEVQTAYGKEDLQGLRALATPEMASYFSDDLAETASRGQVDKISDVKLLQGDLSEAWREGTTDYATVAMRFSLNDQLVERASGRVVEGGPEEATEVWTFMRTRGGAWLVSAIQQS